MVSRGLFHHSGEGMAWEPVMEVVHCTAEREREVGREGEIERECSR